MARIMILNIYSSLFSRSKFFRNMAKKEEMIFLLQYVLLGGMFGAIHLVPKYFCHFYLCTYIYAWMLVFCAKAELFNELIFVLVSAILQKHQSHAKIKSRNCWGI